MISANEEDNENVEIEIADNLFIRRRIFIYCVIAYVVLPVTVTLCIFYVPKLPDGLPCPFHMSVPLSNPRYHPNGTVEDDGFLFLPSHLFNINDTLYGCKCQFKPCIRKCCPEDENLARHPTRCVPNPGPPPFENFSLSIYYSVEEAAHLSKNDFDILYGQVCKYKFQLNPEKYNTDVHWIMYNGLVLFDGKYLDTSQYCLDSLNGSNEIKTYVCLLLQDKEEEMYVRYLDVLFLLFGSIFLLATLIVYCIIPDLRNLHGKSLMRYVASLLATNIGFSIIIRPGGERLSHISCVTIAFVMEFTYLATFFWLNVMCFDIWWGFSGLRAPGGSVEEREHKKFVMYSVYAWGMPALILATSLIMDFVPFIPDSFIKPGFGDVKCWFKDYAAELVYFLLPITIIVLLNITMFVSTACKLQAHSKETKVLHGTKSRGSTKAELDRFELYPKLFVVMGINWVLGIVVFFVDGPTSLWFFTDIGNALQGVLIFLIFVGKRRVLRMVCQKFCPRWIPS